MSVNLEAKTRGSSPGHEWPVSKLKPAAEFRRAFLPVRCIQTGPRLSERLRRDTRRELVVD
jgi:hypothetical protein